MIKFLKRLSLRCIRAASGYFTQLLISLILLFIFRPYCRGGLYMAIWQFFLIIVFLSAIFNCLHSKKVKIASACFAIPAIISQWLNLGIHSTGLTLSFLFFSVIFIFITTTSILKKVLINARVRLETLKGVVCAYFMIAFGFSFIYFFIALILPDSFYFTNVDPATLSPSHFLSEMMYFSFVTLLCIGFGDINAISDTAQTFTVLEGILGQFYIAILVSRLVAVYSFFEHKLHLVSKKKQ